MGREPHGPRRIGGGDIAALVLGGAIILGLVGYNLTLHGRISEMQRSEQIAWDQATGLEERLSGLQTDARGGGPAERWAGVLDTEGVLAVDLVGEDAGAWGRGFYAPVARRLLLVLGGLPTEQGALVLALGEEEPLEVHGALNVDPSGHVVVCMDGVGATSCVRITAGAPEGVSNVLLEGRLPPDEEPEGAGR